MKKLIYLLLSLLFIQLTGSDIRPVRDDTGYGWEKEIINSFMSFLKSIEQTKTRLPELLAGISPHDDYLYAGRFYYQLFKHIKTREAIIFGVTHGTVRKAMGNPKNKIILDDYEFWSGPFRQVPVSPLRELIKKHLNQKHYLVSKKAHELEHSIEALIPFLQYFNPQVKITAIMVTEMNFKTVETISRELANIISLYIKKYHLSLGSDLVILISADANHYGPDFHNTTFGQDDRAHQTATAVDKKITHDFLSEKITREKIAALANRLWTRDQNTRPPLWCGKYCLPLGLLTVLELTKKMFPDKKLFGKILGYADTYSGGVLPFFKKGLGITAPFSLKHWVGFFSAGFYLK